MKKYSKMKDSGIGWVGKIPDTWNVKRLKFTTSFDNSTVNRHTHDDEIKVSICHYPQVYNNEKISLKTIQESGTCTKKELDKFQLKKDDVLITKDSETRDDIGVPVYVEENFDRAVSGYHIAHLTSNKNEIIGSFLFRYLQSDIANGYFETEANGVTRFGLGKGSISNLKLILPSLLEQKHIVEFLDTQTTKIDSDIQKNLKLIILLKEKRQSTIHEAVVKGLDPTAPMKDYGMAWVGEIPEHWKYTKLKYIVKRITKGTTPTTINKQFTDKGIKFVKAENLTEKNTIDSLSCLHIDEETNRILQRSSLKKNDVLVTIAGVIGRTAIVKSSNLPANTNQAVSIISPKLEKIIPAWIAFSVKGEYIQNHFKTLVVQTAQANLSLGDLGNTTILNPPLNEQKEIVEFIVKVTTRIDSLISKIEYQIEKLQELKQSMISSAVTGKIDVRGTIA
jgi:type I restriction enzyme, S subunit